MKENDKKLKDLFREKNLENAFTPDEQNWKKLAAVLEDERKGNKKGLIYISLLLLLGGLGTALFFGLQDTSELKSVHSVPQQTAESIVSPVKETQSSETLSSEKSADAKAETNQTAPTREKTQSIKTSPKSVNETKPQQAIPTEEVKQIPVAVADKIKPQTINEAPIPADIKTVIKESPVNSDDNHPSQPDLLAKDPETEIAPIALIGDGGHAQKEEEKIQKNEATTVEEPVVTNIETEPAKENISVDVLPMKNYIILPPTIESIPNSAFVAFNDSMAYHPLPTHRIYLEAGTSYMAGWNGGTEAKGFNPLAGLQYYHDINKRMGLSLGVMYTTVDHLANTSHTSTTTHLKFGEESDVTVISAVKMHYLLMPFKFNYALSRNDFVGIGYTLAWLVDAESKVEELKTRQGNSSSPVASRSMGYTKGFSSYDGQISACYRRRLYKELYLSGELFYGLQDIKNNNIYQGGFDRNMGFRLSLGINLWKK